jgi:predicted GIY-YIG superfamily endonuclease
MARPTVQSERIADMFTVYILRCNDDSFYVGHTADLLDRLAEHANGRGCVYTAERRPVRLVYSESLETRSAAARRERQIKGWTVAKKEALINGQAESLHRLAIRRVF